MPHANGSAAAANRNRLVAVLALSLVMVIVEIAGGLASNSLALLADAGHMLADVSGIGLALLAIWIAGRAPTNGRTFGYLRLEIIAAVTNALLLFGVAAFILFEAWQRLSASPEVGSLLMLAVALTGLAVNGISLYLLRQAQRDSLNMRGAYLEVMGDFAGSAAVIVAAIVIAATGVGAGGCRGLGRSSRYSSCRGRSGCCAKRPTSCSRRPRRASTWTTSGRTSSTRPGSSTVHDLHAWTITSGMNVVSAHVIVADGADPAVTLDDLCACLSDDFDIEHSTFQLETADRRRFEERSHA